MGSLLEEELALKTEPVGIWFAEEKPDGALEFPSDKRVCVIAMMNACNSGKVVAVSDETCGCPGGAVGLCFGNGFARRNAHTDQLLSTGVKDRPDNALSAFHTHGERFFASPELARRWMSALPYTQAPGAYRVFAGRSRWPHDNPPDLVYLQANPDQLSAIVIMCGYARGTVQNVVAPFVSACQSILMAYQEIGKEQPQAILGGFDISQRNRMSKEMLTLTMPYQLLKEIEEGIDEGCLTTESWRQVADRFV